MRALEEDQYCRKTAGYLPEASVAFVDEIFKANSSILNTLLTILNERLFDNGSVRSKIPLVCLVSPFAQCLHAPEDYLMFMVVPNVVEYDKADTFGHY